MKKDTSPYVAQEGREAINFQITASVVITLCALSIFICVGVVLTPIAAIAALVFTIIGTIKASDGRGYRYPVNVRLL